MSGYDTGTVCRILQVSRSAYYRKIKRSKEKETAAEKAVIRCFRENSGRYGRIRIRKTLEKHGVAISEWRIARILKEHGLVAKSGRTGKRKPPKPTGEQYFEENLVKDKFSEKEPNRLWCSDITVLTCHSGKLYLCGILDVATRRVVGWAIERHQRQTIVQDAFLMAVGRNPKRPEDAIYHSDRGSQYTAKRTKELVEQYGFRKSMSRPGTPSDNQPIESFWQTLKREMPDIRHLPFEKAKLLLVEYIELYYNAARLHSGIGYLIPNDFFTVLSVHSS